MGIRQNVVNGLFRQGGGEINPEAQPTYNTGIPFIDKRIQKKALKVGRLVEQSLLEGRQYQLVRGASETGIIDTRSLADKERLVIEVPPQVGPMTPLTPGVRYELKRSEAPKFQTLRDQNGGRITLIHPGDGNGKPVAYGEVYDLTVTGFAVGPEGQPLSHVAKKVQVLLSSVHPVSGLALGDTVARNMSPQYTEIDIDPEGHILMGPPQIMGDFAGRPTTFAHDGSNIHLVNKSLVGDRPDVSREIPLGLRVVEPMGTVNIAQPHMMFGDPTESWRYQAANQNSAAIEQPRSIQIIDPTIPR